ncbi:T9SS type A sorting domain-containing protein [Psychroserpens sp.]|uniref:T9SS type A sorting domain-containing protein n=1 Tax=Psychroserpens sp. TaxID=2020870 RepID=UPI002B271969|nr:T9SS type A sorting domain-containing protein [Psychroserpens sp.]
MKKHILLLILISASITTNAQNEFTGEGDGYSWDDPFNWISGDVPFNGEDVLIDGFAVEFIGSSFTYGSLSLANGANLLMYGDLNISGNLNVDNFSVISPIITDLNDYAKVILGGGYSFFGDVDISFSAYVPQIGNSYQIIQGNSNFCNIATTDIVPENQSGGGYETTLGIQCQADGILFTVIGINYTSAKSWDGEAGNGLWNTPTNWDPNGVPLTTDIVIINSPTGATVTTDGAGTTTADRIIIGDNNELVINGNLDMFSFVGVNESASLNWKAGSLSRIDTNVQSFIINRGSILVDGPGDKTIENGFEITSQGANSSMVVSEKGFDINNGTVTIYRNNLVIDGDNIIIGYTSGSQHTLRILNSESLIKTSGTGISSVNLTDLQIGPFASVICQEGTLAFGENLTNNGTLSGSGSFQLPNSHVETGKISPGNSPGILTIVGNLTTASEAVFNIEIDGPTIGTEYDKVVVQNNADISGGINIILGYLPPTDAVFEIISASSLNTTNLPETIEADFGGNSIIFSVESKDNAIYLVGPGATLNTLNDDLAGFKVYPNPTNGHINVNVGPHTRELNIIVSNILGQVISNERFVNTNTVDLTIDGSPGIYFVNIKTLARKSKTMKIIKR